MSWKDVQKEIGLPDSEISRRVRERVTDYNDTFAALANARKAVKTATGDEKEELEQNIETMEKGLLIMDKTLTSDMRRLKANGARYKELGKNLKKSGKAKAPAAEPVTTTAAQGGPATPPPPAAEPAKTPEPPKAAEPTKTAPAAPTPPTPPGAGKQPAKKKDNTVVTVLGLGAFLVAAFFGIRWYNNRNS